GLEPPPRVRAGRPVRADAAVAARAASAHRLGRIRADPAAAPSPSLPRAADPGAAFLGAGLGSATGSLRTTCTAEVVHPVGDGRRRLLDSCGDGRRDRRDVRTRRRGAARQVALRIYSPRTRGYDDPSSGQMTRDRSNVTALLDEARSYSRQ